MPKIRVAIGVAAERQEGWLAFTEAELDATSDPAWRTHFAPGCVDNILAEHVWEHLTWTQAKAATQLCYKYLAPGGRLRLAVPDCYHASSYIADVVSATGSKAAEHNHLVDYNYRLMSRLLSECGFIVELKDWWDEGAVFHNEYVSDSDGYIIRSHVNWPKHPSIYRDPAVYERITAGVPEAIRSDFIERKIEHTSLIVDGIKPQ